MALGTATQVASAFTRWLDTARRARKEPVARTKLHRAPCGMLLSVLGLFASRRTRERVFGQIVRDVREEYYEALAEGSWAKARAIAMRGRGELVEAFLRTAFGRLLRLAVGDWLDTFPPRSGAD
jgi:hypothetical protein